MDPQKILSVDLLAIFGLENAPQETKNTFLEEATRLVLAKVAARIETDLPQEKREEFTALFSAPGPEEEQARFLTAYIPNFEEVVVEEALLFKTMMQKISEGTAEQKI